MLSPLLVAIAVLAKPAPTAISAPPRTASAERRLLARRARAFAPDARGGYPLEIVWDDPEGTFDAVVHIVNLETQKQLHVYTNAGEAVPSLPPGRYKILTESARKGFPQEATYDVVDAKTGATVSTFPRSHVAITNIVVEKGQRLRVTVLGSIRPYNAVFYKLGPANAPVAHLFARPYPANDFEPGAFNGTEQFSAAPIAIAFWGMKAARENAATAKQIETSGVPGMNGDRIKDPILVLGVRRIAEDLADTFIRMRGEHPEDVRGQHHVTFLIVRGKDGKIPPSLLAMARQELAMAFETHLLWMMRHNVHRPNEGGGYAGKTFEQDLQEGIEKVSQWPAISRQSTEIQRGLLREIEASMQGGADPEERIALSNGSAGRPTSLLRTVSQNLIKAAARERMNYATYAPDLLAGLAEESRQSIADRDRELRAIIDTEIARLKLIAPGEEINFLKFQKPSFAQ